MAGLFLSNLWRAGCIALALLCVGLFIANKSARSDLKDARVEIGKVEQRLATSNASIKTLRGIVAMKNAESDKRAAELARSGKLAEQQAEQMARLRKGSNKRIVQLNEVAANGSSECVVPDAVRDALEGL